MLKGHRQKSEKTVGSAPRKPRKVVVIVIIGVVSVVIAGLVAAIALGDARAGGANSLNAQLARKFASLFPSTDEGSLGSEWNQEDPLAEELRRLGLDSSFTAAGDTGGAGGEAVRSPYVEVLFDEYVASLGSAERVRLQHKLNRMQAKAKAKRRMASAPDGAAPASTQSDASGHIGTGAGTDDSRSQSAVDETPTDHGPTGSVGAPSSSAASMYGRHVYLPAYRATRWARSHRRPS
jgi:hypothetical protein